MLKRRILNDAFVSQRLIAIRTPMEKWGDTIVGHVKALTPQNITIDEIDEYGCPIGTTTFKIDSLIDVVIDDKTLKCLEIMERQHEQPSFLNCTTFWGNGHELREHITDRMKEKKITTLFVDDGENYDTNIIGIVEDIDEKNVLVEIIDRYGEDDGKILLPIETITGIRWESMEDNARWILYTNNIKREKESPSQ